MRHLEISVHNVHLAFEDTKAKVNRPFTCGLTFDYFKFQVGSTDRSSFLSPIAFRRQPMIKGNMATPEEDSTIVHKVTATISSPFDKC